MAKERVQFVLPLLLAIVIRAEYRWYDVSVEDVTSTYQTSIEYTYSADTDNKGFLVVSARATVDGCSGPKTLITYINGNIVDQAVGKEPFPWSAIRYTQEFYDGASCWQMFGEDVRGDPNDPNNRRDYGLIPFDIDTDTVISNDVRYGSWTGQTARCDNDASNHWHVDRGLGDKGSIRVQIRRNMSAENVGIGTYVDCVSSGADFKYRFIQVGYYSVDCASLDTFLDSCSSNYDGLVEGVSANSQDVVTNAGDIAGITGNIVNLTSSIGTNSGRIAANEAAIAELDDIVHSRRQDVTPGLFLDFDNKDLLIIGLLVVNVAVIALSTYICVSGKASVKYQPVKAYGSE